LRNFANTEFKLNYMLNTNGKKKFRIRITGFETKPAASFQFNPLNWRRHGDVQRDALRTMLGDVGWVQGVIENRRTGNLIDGHARIEEALRDDPKQLVPYLVVDLSPAEERAVLATLDPIGALAEVDQAALDLLYDQTIVAMPGLEQLLGVLHLDGEQRDLHYVEPDLDHAAELTRKWKTARGQMWTVGRHRLMCGDSTSDLDVGRLCGQVRAQLVFTDPPYGVNYTGGVVGKRAGLVGDKKNAQASLYAAACRMAFDFSDDQAPIYLWQGGLFGSGHAVMNALDAAGYKIRNEIVWHKNNAQFGALSAQYKQKHELCYYCIKLNGQAPRWYGPNNEITVWNIDRAVANEYHPTQKPVELAHRAIQNSSASGDCVLDLFLGSGSTMIAAENLNRRCYAMEIDPAYCAVVLDRITTAFPKLKIQKSRE
jgi:DNA modification methylase